MSNWFETHRRGDVGRRAPDAGHPALRRRSRRRTATGRSATHRPCRWAVTLTGAASATTSRPPVTTAPTTSSRSFVRTLGARLLERNRGSWWRSQSSKLSPVIRASSAMSSAKSTRSIRGAGLLRELGLGRVAAGGARRRSGALARRHTSGEKPPGPTRRPAAVDPMTADPEAPARQTCGCCRAGWSRPDRPRWTQELALRSTVPRGRRRGAVSQDVDVFPGDDAEQVRQLLAVPALLARSARTGPSPADPLVLRRARSHEVGYRLEAVGPQVDPVGVRTVDGVADDGNQLGVGQARRSGVGGEVPQVERCALAATTPDGAA